MVSAACAPDRTICERTGQCVSVTEGGEPISEPPPLEAVQIFSPPVVDARAISSTFGPRWKQSAARNDFHLGIDYYGDAGAPLLAIGDGVVTATYSAGSDVFPNAGNVIVIEHAIPPREFHGAIVDRVFAVYLHVETIGVAAGDAVTTGQTVGTMGMTGETEFVHLHFETRVGTICSLEYQTAHPTSGCVAGFDPHVHPYLFVGGDNADAIAVEDIASDAGYAVLYRATRGDLDLDVIETDLGTLGFDARTGIDVVGSLDDFDYGFVELVPREFVSASETLEIELHFAKRPAFLEVRDIYGRGLRYGNRVQ